MGTMHWILFDAIPGTQMEESEASKVASEAAKKAATLSALRDEIDWAKEEGLSTSDLVAQFETELGYEIETKLDFMTCENRRIDNLRRLANQVKIDLSSLNIISNALTEIIFINGVNLSAIEKRLAKCPSDNDRGQVLREML